MFAAPLIQLEQVSKAFAGVAALKGVRLSLHAGEILGLIGENGAGKSTLIRILSGVHLPDEGTVTWLGTPVRFRSPAEALAAGIATIHQESAYFSHLSVAENLLLGTPWPRHWWGGVNWTALERLARKQLARFDLSIAPELPFHQLSAAQKQEVAIVRALSRNARLIILDEPTASLSEPEVQRLFSHLRRLKAEGIALLYISHRLDEILSLTDRIAVLRDGELVAAYPTDQASPQRLVRDMVGRSLDQVYPRSRPAGVGPPLLELRRLGCRDLLSDIHLTLHAGEIVGLAGLIGAGRSELGRVVFGLQPFESGEIYLRGRRWIPTTPWGCVEAGLAYVPEERKRQGFVLEHSVRDSMSIGWRDLIAPRGLIRSIEESQRYEHARKSYGIRAAGPLQPVGTLSGGNQQKALLARWLDRGPDVAILDEPTRGVDVAAKAEIHGLIDRLAAQGKAVLLISSDLPEVLGMSDRVLVMHRGRITAELRGASMTQENVLLAASGLPLPHPVSEHA